MFYLRTFSVRRKSIRRSDRIYIYSTSSSCSTLKQSNDYNQNLEDPEMENRTPSSNSANTSSTGSEWELLPNAEATQSVTVNIKKTPGEVHVPEEEDIGLIQLCSGLLEAVDEVLYAMDKKDVERIFKVVIKADFIIILVQHSSDCVRLAACKVSNLKLFFILED